MYPIEPEYFEHKRILAWHFELFQFRLQAVSNEAREDSKKSLLLILQSDGDHQNKEEFDWLESTECVSQKMKFKFVFHKLIKRYLMRKIYENTKVAGQEAVIAKWKLEEKYPGQSIKLLISFA